MAGGGGEGLLSLELSSTGAGMSKDGGWNGERGTYRFAKAAEGAGGGVLPEEDLGNGPWSFGERDMKRNRTIRY